MRPFSRTLPTQASAATPVSSTYSWSHQRLKRPLTSAGIAIKGASTADLTKSTMPKHFTQPLTCFYWHKNGVCTKKDEDCLLVHTLTSSPPRLTIYLTDCTLRYAHYYTGVVAAAPVTVRGGNGTSDEHRCSTGTKTDKCRYGCWAQCHPRDPVAR